MTNKSTAAETAENTAVAAKFGKEQILSAKKYAERRDLLAVLLTGDRLYTLDEVDQLIKDFLKKEVK